MLGGYERSASFSTATDRCFTVELNRQARFVHGSAVETCAFHENSTRTKPVLLSHCEAHVILLPYGDCYLLVILVR